MSLEIATYINGLDVTNPTATDPKSQGDDHLRLLKSTLKATFPAVTGAVTASHTQLNNAALGNSLGLHNWVHNGNFYINQRAFVSGVALSAGVYGHDRWKAGVAGCTYTYATSANQTTLNISTGTLIHIVHGSDLQSGPVVLSWSGSAVGRINGGGYAVSPVLATATGGTNLTMEFSTGTLGAVQMEYGAASTSFENRPYMIEKLLCQEFLEVIPTGGFDVILNNAAAGQNNTVVLPLKVTKRSTPGISSAWTQTNCGSPTAALTSKEFVSINTVNTAAGQFRLVNSTPLIISCDP